MLPLYFQLLVRVSRVPSSPSRPVCIFLSLWRPFLPLSVTRRAGDYVFGCKRKQPPHDSSSAIPGRCALLCARLWDVCAQGSGEGGFNATPLSVSTECTHTHTHTHTHTRTHRSLEVHPEAVAASPNPCPDNLGGHPLFAAMQLPMSPRVWHPSPEDRAANVKLLLEAGW